MTKLTLIIESPSIYIAILRYGPAKVISTTDIYNFLSNKMVQ
jgi:hypothetical protein